MKLLVMIPAGFSLPGFDYQQESLGTGNSDRQRLPGVKKPRLANLFLFLTKMAMVKTVDSSCWRVVVIPSFLLLERCD
tara:strand:- start:61 stop:294 length:234 start_codon:yes stop_codon:yes gene_type:complete